MKEMTEDEIGQTTYSMMLAFKGQVTTTGHIPTKDQIQDMINDLHCMMEDYDQRELEALANYILGVIP